MIYVMSDIHGNERRFNSIMKQIDLRPEDTLYVLGDVVDRHPGGIRILRQIMAMPNAKMILGNHEYMMLRALGQPYDDFVDTGTAWEHWYRNGGKATYDHFKYLRKTMRQEIIDWIRALPVGIDIEVNGIRYRLAHAAPADGYQGEERYRNPSYYAVWKRFEDDYVVPGEGILVFGHTPTDEYQKNKPMELWYGTRKIGIDCGSGYAESGPESGYGRLACLRLDDGKVYYSEERSHDH